DAAEQPGTARHARDRAGALDRLAFLDVLPVAEQRRADVVLLEVEREAGDAVLELEHLRREAVLEPVDACDPVPELQDGADLGEVGLDVVLLDSLLEDRGDLFRAKLQVVLLSRPSPARGAAAPGGRGRWRRVGGIQLGGGWR